MVYLRSVSVEAKSCIRIRIYFNSDPQHCILPPVQLFFKIPFHCLFYSMYLVSLL